MPTVEYVSLIHCQQFSYETIYSHDVSDSVPDLYLECSIPHNFDDGPLRNANWMALLWVYLQRYRSRMTGETLERECDTDSEAEAYGHFTAPDTPIPPPQDQNHIVGVGPSAGSLLGHQMKNNPRLIRDFSVQLFGKIEGGPKLVENMITGESTPWELATILNDRIGSGKRLDPKSNFGNFHHCSDCSQRLSGLSFAAKQFKKGDDNPTCIACHAENYGEPRFRASDWRLKDDVAMACPLANYLRAHGRNTPGWLQNICAKEDPVCIVVPGTQNAPAADQSAPAQDCIAERVEETATGEDIAW